MGFIYIYTALIFGLIARVASVPESFSPDHHSGPTEVEDYSLPPPNMAATKTGEQACSFAHNVSIVQKKLANRPNGRVELICICSGVRLNEIEFFWWLIDDTNSPLYTYSKHHGIDEIAVPHNEMVEDEMHEFANNIFNSTLILKANLTGYKKIRCEYNMKDLTVCKDTIRIGFTDPGIEMQIIGPNGPSETGNHTRYYAGVVCTVDAAAGQPRFAIGMEGYGEEPGEILTESTVSIQRSDYFYADHFATLSIGSNVNITCRVTDDAGTYVVNKSVTLKDSSHRNRNTTDDMGSDRLYPRPELKKATSILASLLFIMIGFVVILWKKMRRYLAERDELRRYRPNGGEPGPAMQMEVHRSNAGATI